MPCRMPGRHAMQFYGRCPASSVTSHAMSALTCVYTLRSSAAMLYPPSSTLTMGSRPPPTAVTSRGLGLGLGLGVGLGVGVGLELGLGPGIG